MNPIAGSSKGYKHTSKSIETMKNLALGRKHTKETRNLMSKNREGEYNPFYGKKHKVETIEALKSIASKRNHLPVPGIEVEVTDIFNKITTVYNSIREASKALDSDIKTLIRRENSQLQKGINTPYRDKYIINIKRNKI